jgi:hypothetical protein
VCVTESREKARETVYSSSFSLSMFSDFGVKVLWIRLHSTNWIEAAGTKRESRGRVRSFGLIPAKFPLGIGVDARATASSSSILACFSS